jgi:hypothetical protein
MKTRTVQRLRHALRLVASMFLLSSPCGGQSLARPEAGVDAPAAVAAPAPAQRPIR